MTKKEFMLQVIAFLPDWQLGRGLKPLIENNLLDPEVFEKLYEIFRENVQTTYTEVQKLQFKERLEKIEEMKAQEAQKNQEELVNLDAMFETL